MAQANAHLQYGHQAQDQQDGGLKKVYRQSTKAAQNEWNRSKKNIGKMLTFTRDDLDAKKIGSKMIKIDEKDVTLYELVTDVPYISSPCVYFLFILNIFLPGFGTMIASCFAKPCSKTQFLAGLLQFYLAFFIIGWVLSIYWGVLLINKSRKGKPDDEA